MSTRRDLPNAPYLAAVTGRKPSRIPVWFMRQAGRSLPEYRALRAQHSMLAACFEPDLVCEVTLQPVRRHGVDAAILFSDIVVPLRAAGIALDIVPDVGPVIEHPIRTTADVNGLKPLDPDNVSPVADAVGQLVNALGEVPLIGFAGAPFTWRPTSSRAAQPSPRTHKGDDARRTADVACADVGADRGHDRVPAGSDRRRRRRDPGVRLVGRRAVARRLHGIRVTTQRKGFRRTRGGGRSDDALRRRNGGVARRGDDRGRRDRGRRRLAHLADRRRGPSPTGDSAAGQPRSRGSAGRLAGGRGGGPAGRRRRPASSRCRRGGLRLQPRPRRAAGARSARS